MPIGKVWIYRLLFVCVCVCVCVCVFVRLRISPPRIKLAASNLHGGLSASKAGNLTFWGTLLSPKPKIGRIGQRAGHAHPQVNITVEMRRRKRHARDAPFVKSRDMWT